jgi:hypothetical protein
MLRGRIEIFEHVLATYDLSAAHRSVLERRMSAAKRELATLSSAEATPTEAPRGRLRRLASDLRWYRFRAPRDVQRAFPDLRAI